jgi:hypothetical protein
MIWIFELKMLHFKWDAQKAHQLLNDFLIPSLDGKMFNGHWTIFFILPKGKREKWDLVVVGGFFIIFFWVNWIFLVAKHFPTTFGEKYAQRLLYDFPPNYPTWPCLEKHQFFFPLLENEKEKNYWKSIWQLLKLHVNLVEIFN